MRGVLEKGQVGPLYKLVIRVLDTVVKWKWGQRDEQCRLGQVQNSCRGGVVEALACRPQQPSLLLWLWSNVRSDLLNNAGKQEMQGCYAANTKRNARPGIMWMLAWKMSLKPPLHFSGCPTLHSFTMPLFPWYIRPRAGGEALIFRSIG